MAWRIVFILRKQLLGQTPQEQWRRAMAPQVCDDYNDTWQERYQLRQVLRIRHSGFLFQCWLPQQQFGLGLNRQWLEYDTEKRLPLGMAQYYFDAAMEKHKQLGMHGGKLLLL